MFVPHHYNISAIINCPCHYLHLAKPHTCGSRTPFNLSLRSAFYSLYQKLPICFSCINGGACRFYRSLRCMLLSKQNWFSRDVSFTNLPVDRELFIKSLQSLIFFFGKIVTAYFHEASSTHSKRSCVVAK